jgi:hypothetical protein
MLIVETWLEGGGHNGNEWDGYNQTIYKIQTSR